MFDLKILIDIAGIRHHENETKSKRNSVYRHGITNIKKQFSFIDKDCVNS